MLSTPMPSANQRPRQFPPDLSILIPAPADEAAPLHEQDGWHSVSIPTADRIPTAVQVQNIRFEGQESVAHPNTRISSAVQKKRRLSRKLAPPGSPQNEAIISAQRPDATIHNVRPRILIRPHILKNLDGPEFS